METVGDGDVAAGHRFPRKMRGREDLSPFRSQVDLADFAQLQAFEVGGRAGARMLNMPERAAQDLVEVRCLGPGRFGCDRPIPG